MTDIISKNLDETILTTKSIFKNSSDLVYDEIQSYSGKKAFIVYIEGLINKDMLNRDVITPLINDYKNGDIKKCLHTTSTSETRSLDFAINKILDCNVVIFIDGFDLAYIIDLKQCEKRAIEEPSSDVVIRGPKEGFIENIRINTALIRRKLKNPNLIFEPLKIGTQTRTDVFLAYIDGIVNPSILSNLKNKLNSINIDGVLESGYIEQYIQDETHTFFSTIGNTQKPDIVAAKLLEGRIAILCDGTPHVLTVPYLFVETLQSSEDYYIRPSLASFLRILRMLAFLISIFLPALYVALQTFHQEMIPTVLLLRMASTSEGIPFPSWLEAFIMITMFELFRESGTRLPRQIGSAVSIVGALVLGDAAVKAGIVSTSMVIITSVTAISSFIIPSLTEVLVLIRYLFLFLGAFLGLYGIACGIFILTAHMLSLNSFEVPYLSPILPFDRNGFKDFALQPLLKSMTLRPKFISKFNIKRRK